MEKPFLKFGLYYALVYVLGTFIIYLIQPEALFNTYVGWVWIILLVATMVYAVKSEKSKYPDSFSFQQGFKQSWLTFVIGTAATMAFHYILMNFIDPSLLELNKEAQIAGVEKMAKALNLSQENIDKQIETIRAQEGSSPSKLLLGFAMSLLMGAIPSVIIAAIFKKQNHNKSTI